MNVAEWILAAFAVAMGLFGIVETIVQARHDIWRERVIREQREREAVEAWNAGRPLTAPGSTFLCPRSGVEATYSDPRDWT